MTDKENSPFPKTENQYTSTSFLDDGFSFVDFIEVLIRKKIIILLTMAFSTFIAMGYVFFITPVYKINAGFLPPQKTILPKAFPNGILIETRENLYKTFLERLLSFKHQEEVFKSGNFFEKFSEPNSTKTPQDLLLDLNSKIKIKQDIMAIDKLFNKPVYLELIGTKPEAMAEFLDSLYKTAIISTRTEALNPVIAAIDKMKDKMKKELPPPPPPIDPLPNPIDQLQSTIDRLQDNIDYLNKQLVLSHKFNVIDNNFQHARAGAGQPKWFLSGQKVLIEELRAAKLKMVILSQEIKSQEIKPKKSNSASKILQIRDEKLQELQELQHIDISQLKIEVATVTQPSIAHSTPIKPRKVLIISIGILMGLFLGVILAFIGDVMENLRRRKEFAK
ncbi:MAG: hypothetical protein H8E32_12350 [Nitrospinae bacterium]|nr:hypothetical protein [Nitrospinota bacterium]